MSQVLLLLMKDLRRLWPGLALLYALVALGAIVAMRDPLEYERHPLSGLLATTLPLALLLLSGFAIQLDPLVGTTGFWKTRPIRRGALLAAKALFLFGFLVLPPALAHWGILLAYGLESERAGLELAATILVPVTLVAGAASIASLTASLRVFFALSIAIAVTVSLTSNMLVVGFYEAAPSIPGPHGELILAALALAGAGITLVHQVLTGRTKRSVGLLSVGALTVALAGAFHWDFSRWLRPLPELTAVVSLEAQPGLTALAARRDHHRVSIQAHGTVEPLAFGESASIDEASGELIFPDGQRALLRRGYGYVHGTSLEAAFEGVRWIGGAELRTRTVTMSVAGVDFDSLLSATAALRGCFAGTRYRQQVVGRVPLQAGKRFEYGPVHYLISRVHSGEDGVEVEIRHRRIRYATERVAPLDLVFVNMSRGEATDGMSREASSNRLAAIFMDGPGIEYGETNYRINRRQWDSRGERAQLTDDWFAGAELVFVESIPVGRFVSDVSMENVDFWDGTFQPPQDIRASNE